MELDVGDDNRNIMLDARGICLLHSFLFYLLFSFRSLALRLRHGRHFPEHGHKSKIGERKQRQIRNHGTRPDDLSCGVLCVRSNAKTNKSNFNFREIIKWPNRIRTERNTLSHVLGEPSLELYWLFSCLRHSLDAFRLLCSVLWRSIKKKPIALDVLVVPTSTVSFFSFCAVAIEGLVPAAQKQAIKIKHLLTRYSLLWHIRLRHRRPTAIR